MEGERKFVFFIVKKVLLCKVFVFKFFEVELFFELVKKELFDFINVFIVYDNFFVGERKVFY